MILCQAFADKDVNGIIASVGGSDSIRIIEYLDLDIVLENPKVLMGFSDTTSLLTYLNQKGLVTYYGPTVMSGLAQIRNMPEEAIENIRSVLFDPKPIHYLRPFMSYSDGYPDWDVDGNEDLVSPPHTNDQGWTWLQGGGITKGRLFGGCLDVMARLRTSPYWPELDFWDDKILFLESAGERPTPRDIRTEIDYYGLMGILDRIRGLLYGRPRGPIDNKVEIDSVLTRSIGKEHGRDDLVIVSNMDFGHTDPQFVLPLGVEAEIDPGRRSFRTLEPPTT